MARAVSDVVWDWDLTTNALWWNDGFLTTFGYTAGEIEPSVESWTGLIHPDERNRVVESIRHAIATGAETWSAEYRFQRKDGSHAFVQDRGYILRDAAGKAVRMVGGMRDLTAQKKMEAQYLRAQRMESIGTLAGGIAHDLNNVRAPSGIDSGDPVVNASIAGVENFLLKPYPAKILLKLLHEVLDRRDARPYAEPSGADHASRLAGASRL